MNTDSIAEQLRRNLIRTPTGCLIWTGPGAGRNSAYGHLRINRRWVYVHRLMYEMNIGPIPAGLTIDHLCRVKRCAEPGHLEPVTSKENLRRHYALTTRCPNGHEYTPENTAYDPRRHCRTCRRDRERARRRRTGLALAA
jgi:hypothetical protein